MRASYATTTSSAGEVGSANSNEELANAGRTDPPGSDGHRGELPRHRPEARGQGQVGVSVGLAGRGPPFPRSRRKPERIPRRRRLGVPGRVRRVRPAPGTDPRRGRYHGSAGDVPGGDLRFALVPQLPTTSAWSECFSWKWQARTTAASILTKVPRSRGRSGRTQ